MRFEARIYKNYESFLSVFAAAADTKKLNFQLSNLSQEENPRSGQFPGDNKNILCCSIVIHEKVV